LVLFVNIFRALFLNRLFSVVSIGLFTLFSSVCGQSDLCKFISPVRHKIVSSGSFGEPRSAHFHSGIDIKPHLGSAKDEIIAISEGYISRINLSPDGYGKSLYIAHPCGYTSVYAHLDNFVPRINEYINRVRVATQQSEIDQAPPQNAILVKKGEVLGYLGNSGNSFGAHLHFEIRNTSSEMPINPVLFGIGPKDKIPPIIKGIFLYALDRNRTVLEKKYYSASKNREGHYEINNKIIEAKWPLVGIGIHVYDQSNGAGNHNGIHSAKLFINNQKTFGFSLDSIPFDKSHFLHCHMDYEEKKQNKYVHKCYLEPLNELQIYNFSGNNGLIIPNEIVPDHLSIKTNDVYGNSSEIKFKIIRTEINQIKITQSENKHLFSPTDSVSLITNRYRIDLGPKTFLHQTALQIDSIKNGISMLTDRPTPMFQNITISKHLHQSNKKYDSKYIFITLDEKQNWVNLGGSINNGRLTCHHNSVGKFYAVIDTIPPSIKYLGSSDGKIFKFKIKDNFKTSGKNTRLKYKAHVDGKWVPMDYDEKNDLLKYCSPEKIKSFKINLEVNDYSGNSTTITRAL